MGRGLEEMADDDDHTFEKAEAGASATYPMQVLELFVFFWPCRLRRYGGCFMMAIQRWRKM